MASYPIQNAPDMGGINSFWSTVSKYGGPMRPSRFAVVIPQPPIFPAGNGWTEELAYLCDTAALPSRGWLLDAYKYNGPTRISPLMQEYEQWNCQFVLRDSMLEKQYFDSWMEIIQPGSDWGLSYKKDYCVDIKVYTLSKSTDSEFRGTYGITMKKAWPTSIAQIPLSSGDVGFGKLEVSFVYERLFREEIDPQPTSFELVDTPGITVKRDNGTRFPQIVPARATT